MNATQICALIGLILGVGLIYWIAYRNGQKDGQLEGEEHGKVASIDTTNTVIRELESELRFMRTENWHLNKTYQALKGTEASQSTHGINLSALRELESELRYQQADQWYLVKTIEQLKAVQAFGEVERQTLMAAAEKLRLAADTFRAMSAREQSKQALELRERILVMISLLQPVAQERAA
jgi:hypothetical protein